MRKHLLVLLLLCIPLAPALQAQDAAPAPRSAAELRDIVAPIALYPDDLIGVVLPAAAFPLQLVQAQRLLDEGSEPDASWDEAVVAVMNYPEIVEFLNEDLDWTYSLGLAFINQETEVIAAIQTFRGEAYAAGNLRSDDNQTVRLDDGVIFIEPRADDEIYVPYYEPERVIVQQAAPVYYYYPVPRPVYYYPYPAGHVFNGGYFYGVNTFFSVGWRTPGLSLFFSNGFGHPFAGQFYSPRHFWFQPRVRRGFAGPGRHHYRPRQHRPVRHRVRDHRRQFRGQNGRVAKSFRNNGRPVNPRRFRNGRDGGPQFDSGRPQQRNANNRPGRNQPGVNRPNRNQPNAGRRDATRPGVNRNQPRVNRPGANRRVNNRPGVNERGANRRGAARPGVSRPGTSRRDATRPAANRSPNNRRADNGATARNRPGNRTGAGNRTAQRPAGARSSERVSNRTARRNAPVTARNNARNTARSAPRRAVSDERRARPGSTAQNRANRRVAGAVSGAQRRPQASRTRPASRAASPRRAQQPRARANPQPRQRAQQRRAAPRANRAQRTQNRQANRRSNGRGQGGGRGRGGRGPR